MKVEKVVRYYIELNIIYDYEPEIFGRPKIWAQILRKMDDFPLKFELRVQCIERPQDFNDPASLSRDMGGGHVTLSRQVT